MTNFIRLQIIHFIILGIFALAPLSAGAEYIERFVADITVQRDGSFEVTETIEYTFDGARHGIYREIPRAHHEPATAFWRDRVIDVAVTSVLLDDASVPYTVDTDDSHYFIRIGDPEETVTGRHVYTIGYTVHGGLSYPKGQGTELYWNVTGHGWSVPIRAAEAIIRTPDGLFRTVRSCYSGPLGASTGSCMTSVREDGSVSFRVTNIKPEEGMTIAQSLDVTKTAVLKREEVNYGLLVIPLIFFTCIYGAYRIYRFKTAHKTGAPIIPQYEPYPGIKPMYTGLLMDGRLDAHDITACIVYLAEQGYIKIKKTEKKILFIFEVDDYEISLLKLPDAHVSEFEKRVLELLFTQTFVVGTVVSLSSLHNDLGKRGDNIVILNDLEKDLRKDLVQTGYFEKRKINTTPVLIGVLLFGILLMAPIMTHQEEYSTAGIILAGIVFACVGVYLLVQQRRSRIGYELQDYLTGFKLFLETTERDRYVFHNAPEKSPEQFMEYLPYAIAFGVEDKWAKVFEGITIPNPSWYDGGGVSSFSSTSLTESLGAFSTAFASSSGASASSGGGSSGGGSGGGGGGSW